MAQTAAHGATWADLERTPDDGRVYELLWGQIEAQARPASPHNLGQSRLAGRLSDPFDIGRGGPGGWWLLLEPDVRLDVDLIVVPDLAGWRRERMLVLPFSRPIDLTPDWVCEVVSPGAESRDRIRKANAYLAAGVGYLWLLDPYGRSLESWERRGEGWLRLGGWGDGDRVRIPPFEAIEIDVAEFFPPPTEPAAP